MYSEDGAFVRPPWGYTGYLQVYTGNGKGKSTAAFGLALRAASRGARVVIMQFVKSVRYGECFVQDVVPGIVVEQCGLGCSYDHRLDERDRDAALKALDLAKRRLSEGVVDLLVLDELTIALRLDLLDRGEVESLLDKRLPWQEVVVTGRDAPAWLIERADLVSEMREVRHYFQKGIRARPGIEN